NSNSMMRDFRATLDVQDVRSGERSTGVAHMNSPVYFDGGKWLFFQASFDGQAQRWTGLGVGNRPGVWVMLGGFVMIFVGVVYAFYLKPIIIRRMKADAIAKAAEKKKMEPKEKPAELVS